ncbi:MAG: DNA-binding protein [Chloroflexia bacterium]|nr:DNA-binding protein [Chloroflexia bacterium]
MPAQDELRRRRLQQAVRQIVRLRELGPKTPRWGRAWKRLLWRYQGVLKEEKQMIRAQEFKTGRSFVGRLPEDGDITAALTSFCREKEIHTGWITAIGTVRWAVLGFFDQETQAYQRIPIEQEMEIVSCQGNVSLKGGDPFVHLHAILSDKEGKAYAGHLFESEVFVGEFWLQELQGPVLQRKEDPQTGLSLWEILESRLDPSAEPGLPGLSGKEF